MLSKNKVVVAISSATVAIASIITVITANSNNLLHSNTSSLLSEKTALSDVSSYTSENAQTISTNVSSATGLASVTSPTFESYKTSITSVSSSVSSLFSTSSTLVAKEEINTNIKSLSELGSFTINKILVDNRNQEIRFDFHISNNTNVEIIPEKFKIICDGLDYYGYNGSFPRPILDESSELYESNNFVTFRVIPQNKTITLTYQFQGFDPVTVTFNIPIE